MRWWARTVVANAWLWIAVWIIATGVIWIPAPRIPTLLQDDATSFLPADSPSRRAAAVLRRQFPDAAPSSRAVVVAARDGGLSPADEAHLARVARELATRNDELNWRVRAVALQPYLQPVLESPDEACTVIAVDLPAEMLTHSSVRRVREIQRTLGAHPAPPGLQVEVTGAAAMGELLDANAKRDVDRTTLWALVALAVILLVIYRSPIAMFLPLVSIGAALMAALGAIGWAASWGLPINGLLEMFVIVIVAGSGVDYCLLLFARFREEMAAGAADIGTAISRALVHSGPAILASAGTNAAGLATLALARNRDLHTSGPTIAFAIVLSAGAVMSFTPALMRVLGIRLIRLRGPSADASAAPRESVVWRTAAHLVTRYPGAIVLVTVLILIPPSFVGSRVPSLYDSLGEYPPDSSFVRGARLYETHFHAGEPVAEMTILISADAKLASDEGRRQLRLLLDQIASTLRERFGAVYVRDLRDPLGTQRAVIGGDDNPLGPLGERLAWSAYVGAGGSATRIDVGLPAAPRSAAAMQLVAMVEGAVRKLANDGEFSKAVGASAIEVHVGGESATYADMRALRRRDFRVIAITASALIYAILLSLTRAPVQSVVLIAATLLTYVATYGATFLIVQQLYGLDGLSWQIDFLLFIIIMSLGQDYNIFVVARIQEERRTKPVREAISVAIRRTGSVVSSCGIIMAATFASMFSGSLLVLKEFAIALPLGILIDTFLVRPLLVPALILLISGGRSLGATRSAYGPALADSART